MSTGPLSIKALRKEWAGCTKCPLSESRRKMVFGEGNPHADILLIGLAPGGDEDSTGHPYVGESGHVLNEFLDALKLDRDLDMFITNIVCCRPTALVKRRGEEVIDNRDPNSDERMACWPRLYETIYRVDPLLIITMGKSATSMVAGTTQPITPLRGRIQTAIIQGKYLKLKYPVLPMFHPAFLLRNPSRAPEGAWAKTGDDFAEAAMIVDYLREVYRGIKPPNREG